MARVVSPARVVYPVIPVMQERGFNIKLGKVRVDAWRRTIGCRYGDGIADTSGDTVPSQSGGNPILDNEVSNSYTFGVVLQPSFVRNFSTSADYIWINIKNPISSLSVEDIASACFDNANFNVDDPANGNSYCSQIRRYATGQGGAAANGGDRGGQVLIDQQNPGVRSGFVNGNRVLFEGIQGTVSYITALSGINIPGRFAINGNLQLQRSARAPVCGQRDGEALASPQTTGHAPSKARGPVAYQSRISLPSRSPDGAG